jgi:DNA-binding transcriptional LysR family regulator
MIAQHHSFGEINVDPTSLEIFLAVACETSVTRAARKLARAPSNVTTRIQLLEEQVGAQLFSREGKKMTLTREGRTFVTYARRLVALAEEARLAMKNMATLRVGTMESTAASRLPPVLAQFNENWPSVSLQLTLGATQDLAAAVIADELDCALVARPPRDQTDNAVSSDRHGLLHVTPIYQEELLLILPPNHLPVRDASDIRSRQLAALEPGCTYRRVAERWVRLTADLPTLEVGSYHSMLAHVVAGNAAGVIPRSVLDGMHWSADIEVHSLGPVDTLLISKRDRRSATLQGLEAILVSSGAATPGSSTRPS